MVKKIDQSVPLVAQKGVIFVGNSQKNIFYQVLAFNPAGDGPRSSAVLVRTHQGLPSAPRNITFTDITMNSLVVSWEAPHRRNGLIQSYIVTYETIEQDERKL